MSGKSKRGQINNTRLKKKNCGILGEGGMEISAKQTQAKNV